MPTLALSPPREDRSLDRFTAEDQKTICWTIAKFLRDPHEGRAQRTSWTSSSAIIVLTKSQKIVALGGMPNRGSRIGVRRG